jgi:hypothetical protein
MGPTPNDHRMPRRSRGRSASLFAALGATALSSSVLCAAAFGLATASLVACGGSTRPPEEPLISIEEERAKAERPKGPRRLERAEVNEAIEAGFGRFLQHVFVEPTFVAGKFQGFRIVELKPKAAWDGVDLRPGDVVLQVNGKPIERPEQAHAVFLGLKNADRVVVSYLRDGKPGELVVPIVDADAAATAPEAGPQPRDL